MMAVKYTFDNQFAASSSRIPGPVSNNTRLDAKAVEKLTGEAFANGMATGRDQAMAETAHKISECLNQISGHLHRLAGQEQTRRQDSKRDIAKLAHIIGAKLASTLVGQRPLAELEALVADCFETCQQEPKLLIRVNDALIEPMTQKIDEMKQQMHFEGQITLLGDAGIQPGDGRIEWNDGGAERNGTALNEVIENIIERYVHSLERAAGEVAEGALQSAG
jgi:flagellar assembly protein FliH